MTHLLNGAWRLTETLNFGGIAVAILAVGLFGWTFIKLNAVAARGDSGSVPSASWRGKPALIAITMLACGIGMQALGYVLAVVLQFRT
jgi:hypothetical protein